jgi:hypothetical protein
MKSRSYVIIFLILVFEFAGIAIVHSQPPTNEQLVVSAVKEEIDKSLSKDSTSTLLVISGKKELEILIGGAIADAMRDKYTQVLMDSIPTRNADNLTFDIQGFDFSFYKGASRGFLKAHKIRRQLQAQLRITISSGMDGQLREMKDIALNRSDTIEPVWAKYVNSRNIVELSPQAPASNWSRYVEPTLVIAAVGALVYLFFANR